MSDKNIKLQDIHGIGQKKTDELKLHYNITTVNALRKYVKKIPTIITEAQKAGLKYHHDISKKMRKSQVSKHAKFIKKHIPGATIAGSYRREMPYSNDIDVIVCKPLDTIVEKLKEKKYLICTLSHGPDKYSGIAKLPGTKNHRRIDIIKTTKEKYPFALLYFTGDHVLNIYMRKKAKKLGYTLSQNGMIQISTGKSVSGIKTERDIFKRLGMEYKKPADRSTNTKDYK